MAIIETINSAINTVVWGKPMLVLLVGAGILLTIRTFGVQFRKFGYAMKNTLGRSQGRRNDALPGHEYGAGRYRRYR